MKLIKAIHMPAWSIELFDTNSGFGIIAKNFKTGQEIIRVFKTYDFATSVFDTLMTKMEGGH